MGFGKNYWRKAREKIYYFQVFIFFLRLLTIIGIIIASMKGESGQTCREAGTESHGSQREIAGLPQWRGGPAFFCHQTLGAFEMKKWTLVLAAAWLFFGFGTAWGSPVFFEGFEENSDTWFGSITREGSGVAGIDSSAGGFHAISTGSSFTRFDGYRAIWEGGFTSSLDIFLDASWVSGSGFDYSVAANGSDGNHQRDYIFHVAKDTSSGQLMVGGSNNSNFATREDLDKLNNSFTVQTTGWYTFQHVFYEDQGALAVDLNLLNQGGDLLFQETRFNPADTIPGEVGGNRYGWLTFVDVQEGVAIDNSQLVIGAAEPIPEPGTIALLGVGFLGLLGFRRRSTRKKSAPAHS